VSVTCNVTTLRYAVTLQVCTHLKNAAENERYVILGFEATSETVVIS